jgi:hypothetical protein
VTDYKIRSSCRLCDGPLTTVLQLADTPLANELVDAPGTPQAMYPLSLAVCDECEHYQCPVAVEPSRMFNADYAYVSGTSPVFRAHLEKLARQLGTNLFPGDLVVDVGSNDGTFLSMFDERLRRVGVDPAIALAARARQLGAVTYTEFMTVVTARKIVAAHGAARLVTGLNSLAHIDDMRGVTDAIRELLADDGILVLEVGYFLDMLREGHVDNNYLEHVAHWTLAPMQKFFASRGLCLYDAEHVDSQGGSIRCYVSKRTRRTTDRLDGMLGRERYLVTPEALEKFRARIATTKTELTETLKAIKAQGKTIAAFGCPAKATTLLHHFGIGRETLDYIVEENERKVGRFSPGKHIPVVSVAHFREHPPNYMVLLAWNFQADLRSRHDWFVEGGGQWILPMPIVEVVA